MRQYYLLLLIITSLSCGRSLENPESICYLEADPPRNSQKVTIVQGVWGDVWFWSGNFMPVGRGEICQVVRTVLIYELTTNEEADKVDYTSFYTEIRTKLITTVTSNNLGFFQVKLEPGIYSLFVLEDDRFYSNSFSSQGIFPVTIESGKVSEVRFDIIYDASF